VLGFTIGLAVLTCLLFGLTPALRATRTAPAMATRASGRSTEGRAGFTLRRVLVVGQLAVSLVLLVGALLFVRTFQNLASVDVGFTTNGVVAANFDFRRANLPPDTHPEFHRAMIERVRAVPGVAGATPVFIVPVSGSGWNQALIVDGKVQEGYPNINQVGRDFFTLLDIPITAGRTFSETDTPESPRMAVVNQAFVAKYLSDRDPIGRVFRFERGPGEVDRPMQVVGVVGNTKYSGLRQATGPIIFLNYAQEAEPGASVTALVRLARPGTPIVRELVSVAGAANPNILVTTTNMDTLIDDSLVRERMMAMLSGFFGMLAALLAAIGLYGVMSYMVAQRKQEIGIRMALGAGQGRVLRMVLGESSLLVIIGVVAGAGLAVYASRYAKSLLFGLTPNDPVTIVAAVAGLALIGCAAAFLPAWRAARVPPTTALRES
jgi:predicted permease